MSVEMIPGIRLPPGATALLQEEKALDFESSPASMPAFTAWWEDGAYHVTYHREATEGRWTISRLEYRTLAWADYRPGRMYAVPLSVPPATEG